jgi:hypothetical protein
MSSSKAGGQALLDATYSRWRDRCAGKERRVGEKQRVSEAALPRLNTLFPGPRQDLDSVDGATPLRTQQRTGNWRDLHAQSAEAPKTPETSVAGPESFWYWTASQWPARGLEVSPLRQVGSTGPSGLRLTAGATGLCSRWL